ncbi:mitochondrial protein C2orf69 homolog [Antedon mediterranea]|uniref:mitochondrial protein C2orf69 homolog n=1 Tax=Antedon mediterranea TaxID=105859 RepID=UPI003AF9C915
MGVGFSLFYASNMASNDEQPECRRIELIEGLHGRKNTLISPVQMMNDANSTSFTKQDRESHVVYFPGDVQTFTKEMSLRRVGKKWMNWSFEKTARILQQRFPTSWIWVVRPHRVHEFVFSCFENFVDCNIIGSPIEFEYRNATEHLQLLLQNACKSLENIINERSEEENNEGETCVLDGNERLANENQKHISVDPTLPVKLVGFSKGCVVLNQIVFELKQSLESTTELKNFVKRISAIYWLDGGHSGEENTWVTDRETLEVLANTGIKIHAHVTPYQVDDVARPWIAEEHREFVAVLKELKADITDKIHFEAIERSLKIHFELLGHF